MSVKFAFLKQMTITKVYYSGSTRLKLDGIVLQLSFFRWISVEKQGEGKEISFRPVSLMSAESHRRLPGCVTTLHLPFVLDDILANFDRTPNHADQGSRSRCQRVAGPYASDQVLLPCFWPRGTPLQSHFNFPSSSSVIPTKTKTKKERGHYNRLWEMAA